MSAVPLTLVDPLEALERPDRPHYATGVLLDAQDFVDEQTYHRSRLGRALAYLHGAGTVAGLAVQAPVADGPDFELHVAPGLALDRYGRLIEVPRPWCLRINRWWAALADAANPVGRAALAASLRDGAATVDCFLTHELCPRGRTPSFAEGALDATDATVPHRLRDGFRLQLVPRDLDPADPATRPAPRFAVSGADPAARLLSLQQALLQAWDGSLARPGERSLPALGEPALAPRPEHALLVPPAAAGELPEPLSPASLLLARLRITATDVDNPDFAATTVDNLLRAFAYPGDGLALVIGG